MPFIFEPEVGGTNVSSRLKASFQHATPGTLRWSNLSIPVVQVGERVFLTDSSPSSHWDIAKRIEGFSLDTFTPPAEQTERSTRNPAQSVSPRFKRGL